MHVSVPMTDGCVRVQVGEEIIWALIDTGASVSFISSEFLVNIRDQGVVVTEVNITDSVALADNTVYQINSKVSMLITVHQGWQFLPVAGKNRFSSAFLPSGRKYFLPSGRKAEEIIFLILTI